MGSHRAGATQSFSERDKQDGPPTLTKPAAPHPSIVRLVLKGTVVNLEVKKPVSKWEKISGVPYAKIEPDPETGYPHRAMT